MTQVTSTDSASRLPRILHLIPADGIGGVEVAAKSMLSRRDLPCAFRLRFIEPPVSGPHGWAAVLRVARANWRALRADRAFYPDVIICSLWRSVPLALALRAFRKRAKLVYFLHSGTTAHRLDALASAVARRAADEIWADSAATLEARGVSSGKFKVISFVTGHVDAAPRPRVGPTFVSWGRLHSDKGFDRAIRLIALLVRLGVDARYDIHGPDGGAGEALAALVRELGLERHVRISGALARDELADTAARHSFFLQPSRSEGMCMAAVEAMQLGLVPVATPVGQMAHYVIPGKTGVVVDPADLDRAAVSVAALIADPNALRRLSDAAIRYWHDMPLYADDVCRAATALMAAGRAG